MFFDYFDKQIEERVRYSVLSYGTLRSDLNSWVHMLPAPFLHRPVTFLSPKDKYLKRALQQNLVNALAIGALLTESEAPLDEFFGNIVDLAVFKPTALSFIPRGYPSN